MFAGLTIAMVIGVPQGSFIGNMAGWQWPFLAVFVLDCHKPAFTYTSLITKIISSDTIKCTNKFTCFSHDAGNYFRVWCFLYSVYLYNPNNGRSNWL